MAGSYSSSSLNCAPMTMSTCKTYIVRGTHQFKIIGYSFQKGVGVGNFISSGDFTAGGYNWTIEFYPDGDSKDAEGFISVYLKLKSTASDVKAIFSFKIDDPSGKALSSSSKCEPSIFLLRSMQRTYKHVSYKWGYSRFMEASKLESNYVMDDCLILQCTVEVVKESHMGETTNYIITVPPSDIGQHLLQLLETKQGTDVTFQVEECTFDAHKLVLAMRSPVFNAEFFGSMKEKSMHCIRIEDMEPAVFKALLHFIYSDTLPAMDDLVDDCANKGKIAKMAQHLLVAADRYDLERMRLMCGNILCETIDVETVTTTLKLADQHHCQHLKAFCIEYITSPGIFKAAMPTEDFSDLKRSCPLVIEEILEKLIGSNIS